MHGLFKDEDLATAIPIDYLRNSQYRQLVTTSYLPRYIGCQKAQHFYNSRQTMLRDEIIIIVSYLQKT